MILLDTNIASVLMTPDHPDLATVEAWQRASSDRDIRLSAITLAEVAYGVAILPEGSTKAQISRAAKDFFTATADTVLPFGIREAEAYGQIMADRRAQGHPMSPLDAQIAAIAHVAGAVVATRNTRDFTGCGVPLVSPYAQ